jgi:hypothetical protein
VLNDNFSGDASDEGASFGLFSQWLRASARAERIGGRSHMLWQITKRGSNLRGDVRGPSFGWRSRHDRRNVKESGEFRQRRNGAAEACRLVGFGELDYPSLQICKEDDGGQGIEGRICHGCLPSNRASA